METNANAENQNSGSPAGESPNPSPAPSGKKRRLVWILLIVGAVIAAVLVFRPRSQKELNQALLSACQDGKVAKVRSLLAAGADPTTMLHSDDGSLTFPLDVFVSVRARFEAMAEKLPSGPKDFPSHDIYTSLEAARASPATEKDYLEIQEMIVQAKTRWPGPAK